VGCDWHRQPQGFLKRHDAYHVKRAWEQAASQSVAEHGQNASLAAHRTLALIYHQLLQQASALSYLDGFRVMAVLLLVTVPFVWVMRKPRFKSPDRSAA